MVFTRSQQTPSAFSITSFSIMDAARALLNLRNSNVSVTPTPVTYSTGSTTSNANTQSQTPSQSKFWTSYTNWYHAFLSEATDEAPSASISERRGVATSRWVSFASKHLHCSDSEVRAWLRKADQKALLAASA
jgi:hypothetical protein